MNTKFLLAAMITVALAGCTTVGTTLDRLGGRGVVSEYTSSFDNATVIESSPANLANPDGYWTGNMQLGARWTSVSPDSVALIFYVAPSTPMNGGPLTTGPNSLPLTTGPNSLPLTTMVELYINVDGTVTHYNSGGGAENGSVMASNGGSNGGHYLYGQNAVVIPYTLFQKMLVARVCRLRVQTTSGAMDFDLTRTYMKFGGKPTATLSLREMVPKINAARAHG